MSIRRLPIGMQNFEDIRRKGFVYVDKSRFVFELTNYGSKPYFLSRPRRFGKSLFLSTLKAYFEGKKELFEGLAIYDLEKNWESFPIFYLDLNTEMYKTSQELNDILNTHIVSWEKLYGKEPSEVSISSRFMGVIKRAHLLTGKQAVVLVDEYDKPLLQNIGKGEILEEMKLILKSFYGVLKSSDEHLRFLFLTGVTKFGQVSVFSDLNQIIDLSMDARYSAVCGITQQELLDTFNIELNRLAQAQQLSYDETLSNMKRKYNGYHFSKDTTSVYNPFSVLNTLYSLDYKDYWFQTGTPTFLIQLLKESNYDLNNLEGIDLKGSMFGDYKTDANAPIPVIYQSGYLTIKSYDREFDSYTLGFPNEEVKYGFLNFMLPEYTYSKSENAFHIEYFVKELRAGKIDDFMLRLKTLFASFPYELNAKTEQHYNAVFYLVFQLMGQYISSQHQSALGRSDAVVKTDKYIYIFEFKLDGSAEQAIKQIDEKGYAAPYALEQREIIKIGASFSAEERNIGEYIIGR